MTFADVKANSKQQEEKELVALSWNYFQEVLSKLKISFGMFCGVLDQTLEMHR